MTREEAIQLLTQYIDYDAEKPDYYKMEEACKVAIKALEQGACEDAISRQAVLDNLNRLIEVERLQGTDEMGYGRERVSAYECMIDAVESEYLYPSIQQKPKTGRWIPDDTICEDTLYRCSNCDNVYYSDYGDVKDMGYNYCPNCGAKMESEE